MKKILFMTMMLIFLISGISFAGSATPDVGKDLILGAGIYK